MAEHVCDACAVLAVADALDARTGHLADPHVARAARAFIGTWHKREHAVIAARTALTVGCPKCGARADEWCRTNTGNVYDLTHGPAYVHAARRHALTELSPTEGRG